MDYVAPGNALVPDLLSRLGNACHRLLLVVGLSGSGKTALLRRISEERGLPYVNLGRELSRRLLDLSRRQRKLEAANMVMDILDEQSGTAVAVDDTEIIFEPSLKLNPLGLLHTVSRGRPLIWSIPGRLDGDELVYAYPGHPEHHRIPVRDFQVIEV